MLILLLFRRCCNPSHILQSAVIIIVASFILLGAVIFQALEEENAIAITEQERENFFNCIEQQVSASKQYYEKENIDLSPLIVKNCFRPLQGQWNFAASVLFTFSVVTTIGKEFF
jgi:hypothetical protein